MTKVTNVLRKNLAERKLGFSFLAVCLTIFALSAVGFTQELAATLTGTITDPTRPFRVTLAWTDPPGSTTGAALDNDLDFDLGEEIDHVFGAAIDFGVALLPAEPPDLADRHAGDADLAQRAFDFVELERLDDRLDFFHRLTIASAGSVSHRAGPRRNRANGRPAAADRPEKSASGSSRC